MSPGLPAERFSLGVEDAEMESPVTPAEERPLDVLSTPTDVRQSVAIQKERVRPSMCERDLIMFTPPTNK
ncbi:hypothetical protein PO909_012904 [Leuciscus waleckii]